MIAQRPDIHAQEGYAEQQKDRFGDERLEPLADRRHRDADKHQCCDRAGALAGGTVPEASITDTVVADVCDALHIPASTGLFNAPPAPLTLFPGTLEALRTLSAIATVVTLSNVTCVDADERKVEALQAAIGGPEVVRAEGRHAYIVYPNGIGRSRLTGSLIEAQLGTRGTARNWNTILKLADLAAA